MFIPEDKRKLILDNWNSITKTIEALIPVARLHNKLIRQSLQAERGPIFFGALSFWVPIGSRPEFVGLLVDTDLFGIGVWSFPPAIGGRRYAFFWPSGTGGLYQKQAVRRYLKEFRRWLEGSPAVEEAERIMSGIG